MGFLRLFTRHQPKIKIDVTKKDGFSGWVKCIKCEEMIHENELYDNHNCCPKCNHHYRLSAIQRIKLLADQKTFKELFSEIIPLDPLNFIDSESYKERLAKAKKKVGRSEAITTGICQIKGHHVALGAFDFWVYGRIYGIGCWRAHHSFNRVCY